MTISLRSILAAHGLMSPFAPGAPVRRPESEIDGLPLRFAWTSKRLAQGVDRFTAGRAARCASARKYNNTGADLLRAQRASITVSDANAVLGRLDLNHFLGGSMTLELTGAQAAISTLAADMQLSTEVAAAGIIDIANVSIDRAVRRVSVARGYDPRGFTLLAFGGAGPLHGLRSCRTPRSAACLSLATPACCVLSGCWWRMWHWITAAQVLGLYTDNSPAKLNALVADMLVQAKAELVQEGIAQSLT